MILLVTATRKASEIILVNRVEVRWKASEIILVNRVEVR